MSAKTPSGGQQPPDPEMQELLARVQTTERRRQERLRLSTTFLPDTLSLGERVLPYLFAGMEACFINALLVAVAGFNIFGPNIPVLPLWAPFVLMGGSVWAARYLERRDARNTPPLDEFDRVGSNMPGTTLLMVLLGVGALFLIWVSIYAQTTALYNPTWLLALVNDILLLNSRFWQVLLILMLCVFLAWRGVGISRRVFEPGHVFNLLRVGIGVMIGIIILRAAQESSGVTVRNDTALFLLVPLFLCLSLVAHALAQATFVRHSHPTGLEGSVMAQERSIFSIMGIICVALLIIVLTVGSVASPAFLGDIQRALAPLGALYDLLVSIFAHILTFLVTPIINVLQSLHFTTAPIKVPLTPRTPVGGHHGPKTPQIAIIAGSILAILALLMIIVALGSLVTWTLRRRRTRVVRRRNEDELHESLWSWSLFWTQVKAFLRALLGLLLPHAKAEGQQDVGQQPITGAPAARSVREIYRALLKRAGGRGYPRKREETPNEFQRRLDERTLLAAPELATITEAYTVTRYGEVVPDEAEVARVRGAWSALQQRWGES
ncbi:MAG: DUF4129 domain-containing protein [Chloroflexota bacterium]|nr:DUF4129 domain-containing protein [Chloroflexota bacterium]